MRRQVDKTTDSSGRTDVTDDAAESDLLYKEIVIFLGYVEK